MTKEELEHIQAVCRRWLWQPDASKDSHLTIPPGGALTRAIEVKISALLTFDNVLIMSADDSETGTCYAKLIRQPDGLEEVFDTALENIAAESVAPHAVDSPPLRATQQRYQEAMESLAQTQQRESEGDASPAELSPWIEKASFDSDQQPKYLLYTNGKLLGYSLLERSRSDGQRSGRFHPSEDYFEYAHIFEALPQAENDCMEANAQEGYGIFEAGNDGYRTRFAELSGQIAELELYVEAEGGLRIEASKVELQDLSHHYDDQTERWLHINSEPSKT
jgi:hypothetical protein